MPAFLAQESAPTVSKRYNYISSQTVVENLILQGWQLSTQAKPLFKTRPGTYSKHGATFRHPDLAVEVRPGDVLIPQVTFTNAHNGSSALRLYSGFWRLICTNGLHIPINIHGVENTYLRVRHVNVEVEELYKSILEITKNLHSAVHKVRELTTYELSDYEIDHYASTAFLHRQFSLTVKDKQDFNWFQPVHESVIRALTVSDHKEDRGKTAWEVFNKVQGAIIERGFKAYDPIRNKNRTYKPINSFERATKLNADLYTQALSLLSKF